MEHHVKVDSSSNQSNEELDEMDLRRGPWTVEEDFSLMNYVAHHGEGRWNSLARSSGLKRTGKSCRLRWLNYLRPDVRRGNITLEEQLLILELHSQWGNRWSKIAQHLPGRTDNEIKNYWRTRVQKHAKQLKCDVNSKQFKDTMRYLWMPRLVERIQAAAVASGGSSSTSGTTATAASATTYGNVQDCNMEDIGQFNNMVVQSNMNSCNNNYGNNFQINQSSYTPENSSTAASSDSFGTQVSPISDLTDCYNYPINQGNNNNNINQTYYQPNANQLAYGESLTSPGGYFSHQGGVNYQAMDQDNQWMDGGDAHDDNLWDMWYLQQQMNNNNIL